MILKIESDNKLWENFTDYEYQIKIDLANEIFNNLITEETNYLQIYFSFK